MSSRIRIERRLARSRVASVAAPIASIVLGLLLSGVVLLIAGHDPITAYRSIYNTALANPQTISSTFVSATPLLLTGLAATVAFRMRLWNIGGEGQLYVGAICGSGAGLALQGHGAVIAVPAMIIAGIVGGALWAAVPALLRVYLNTNEILTTLMLNYVAGLLLSYLIFDSYSYWRDTTSPGATTFPVGRTLATAARWPAFVGGNLLVPLGLVVGAVLALGLSVFFKRTRAGYALRVIADSPETARYAGIKTRRAMISVMLLSGSLAGLAGASQVGDFSYLLEPAGLQQSGFGYTGIVVAAIARFSPWAVIPSALFFGVLTNAGFKLAGPDFPQGLVGVMEGIILFCLLSAELLLRYRVGWAPPRPKRGREAEDDRATSAAAAG